MGVPRILQGGMYVFGWTNPPPPDPNQDFELDLDLRRWAGFFLKTRVFSNPGYRIWHHPRISSMAVWSITSRSDAIICKRLSRSPATLFSGASLPNHTKMFELVHLVTSMEDFACRALEKIIGNFCRFQCCGCGFCCAFLILFFKRLGFQLTFIARLRFPAFL
jgi:hypothetical protein